MAVPRKNIVDLEVTPYYHCVARCVRRAFLCGKDHSTGRSYDHRKPWIVERIKLLASLFAIDVCAYAILDNHFHLILRVLANLVDEWTDHEVYDRVSKLCPTTVVGYHEWDVEKQCEFIEKWRGRLKNISWFMGRLNEYIAREANKEDGCTGRFWEARFKSQGLVDVGSLLAAMVYVDLNPIRANMAKGLDDSSWTSIQQRLREADHELHNDSGDSDKLIVDLLARVKSELELTDSAESERPAPEQLGSKSKSSQPAERESGFELPLNQCPALAPLDPEAEPEGLPLSLASYLELLEWTGRATRADGKGSISGDPPQLIERCGLDPERWLETVERFGSLGGFVGYPEVLKSRASRTNRRWLKGQGRERRMGYKEEPKIFWRDDHEYLKAA